jgi:hypothetical protein
LVGWQEKEVLSTVSGSSFFGGLGNQVKRFAGQAYGALDRSVGGVLPGGSDSPVIGKSKAYFKRPDIESVINKVPLGTPFSRTVFSSPFEKDLGKAVDMSASVIAGARPVVQGALSSSPFREATSSILNQLPVSANLFGRYYTGIGSQGLELPQSFIQDVGDAVRSSATGVEGVKKRFEAQRSQAEEDLSRIKQGQNIGVDYKTVNDSLAEIKSLQNKLNQGYVPVETAYSSKDTNPLTSPGTSLGRALFKPTGKGGWKAEEKYDFAYGGADKKTTTKQDELIPSQEYSQVTASALLDRFVKNKMPGMEGASSSPAAFFGRAVVSKMNPDSFEYEINIPRR